MTEQSVFAYELSELQLSQNLGSLLVVSLAGALTKSNVSVFEKLIGELQEKDAKRVVLDLKGVPPVMERNVVPLFAMLQKVIRDKGAQLRLSSIHPDLKKSLESAGILRVLEVSDTVQHAVAGMIARKAA